MGLDAMLRQLKRLFPRTGRVLEETGGATAVEYAIMLALIVIVCLGAITAVGVENAASFTSSSNQMASYGFGG